MLNSGRRCRLPVYPDTEAECQFSMTPILHDSLQVLMLACISTRGIHDNLLVPAETAERILLFPSDGKCSKSFIRGEGLEHLTIHLASVDCINPVYNVWVGMEGEETRELIRVPYRLSGCRASYFPISTLNSTICIVHQLIEYDDSMNLDLFTEEQEFLFNVLEVQDCLFLSDQVLAPIHYVESSVVHESPRDGLFTATASECDRSIDAMDGIFSKELEKMAFILNKYETYNIGGDRTVPLPSN